MLLVRLTVNSKLLVVKSGGTQKLYIDFWQHGIIAPNPHIVQGQL